MSRKKTVTSIGLYKKIISKDNSANGKILKTVTTSVDGKQITYFYIIISNKIKKLSEEEFSKEYDIVNDEEQNVNQYFLNKIPESLFDTFNGGNNLTDKTGYESTPFDKDRNNYPDVNSDFDFS